MGKSVAICLVILMLIAIFTYSTATTRYINDNDVEDDNSPAYINPNDPRIQSTNTQYIQPEDPLGLQFLYYIKSINGLKGYSQDILLRSANNSLIITESGNTITLDVNITPSATYYPTSIITIYGTDTNNNDINAIIEYDRNSFTVQESAGANPLQVDINFTDVNSVDAILMREQYAGGSGHEILVMLYDFTDEVWEEYFEITDQSGFVVSYIPVFDPEKHVSDDGLVMLRFFHTGTGVGTHFLYLDFVWLQEGTTTLASADHDALSGRDNPANHPWAQDDIGTDCAADNYAYGVADDGTLSCRADVDTDTIISSCDNNADCTITGDITGATGWAVSCDNNNTCTITGDITGATGWANSCDNNSDCTITGLITGATGWHNSCDNNSDCTLSGTITGAITGDITGATGWAISCDNNADCTITGDITGATGWANSCDNNTDCTLSGTVTGDITGATGWANSCDNNTDCTLSGTITGDITGATGWTISCDNNNTCTITGDITGATGWANSCDNNTDCTITGLITGATGWHNSCDNNSDCTLSGSISTATDGSNTWQDDIGVDCGAGDFAKGVDDDGTLDCDTPAGGGGDVNATSISPAIVEIEGDEDPLLYLNQTGNGDMIQGFSAYGGSPTKSFYVDENGTMTVDMRWNDIAITPAWTYTGVRVIGNLESFHSTDTAAGVFGAATPTNPVSTKYVTLVRGGKAATLVAVSNVGSLTQPLALFVQASASGGKPTLAVHQGDSDKFGLASPEAPIQVGKSTAKRGISLWDTADGSAHCVTITNNVLAVSAAACATMYS